jgi:primosomal protein N' (replication factor Y)
MQQTMPTFLEIAVNVPQVSGVFDYHLPPELEGKVEPGHLVEVPFGHQIVQGVVIRCIPSSSMPETRPVRGLIDAQAVLTPAQIALAGRVSEETLAPLAACIDLMIPAGLSQQADTLYTLAGPSPTVVSRSPSPVKWNETHKRLVALLQKRGPLRGGQIDKALPRLDWRSSAQTLVRWGVITSQAVLPPPTVRPKRLRTIQLACPPEAARLALPDLGRQGSPALKRRQGAIEFLLKETEPVNVSWVYAETGCSAADLAELAERGLVRLGEGEEWRDPLGSLEFLPAQPPALTGDQQRVYNEIEAGLHLAAQGEAVRPFLLHGVTGSGKTEIYLQAVAETLQSGRAAILLVPEIAMTPQTVQRVVRRFPDRVGLIHSRLSEGERYDTWRRARLGQIEIIVGPRSALFLPLPKIGLIVVDECHDDSYYQENFLPHYDARRAAVSYAQLLGAVCILGSATPNITQRFKAEKGEWTYLSLPARILAHRQSVQKQMEKISQFLSPRETGKETESLPQGERGRDEGISSHYQPVTAEASMTDLPSVRVVDMRLELKAGNRSIFSRPLQASLRQVYQAGEQAILFLNRRGTATYVFCRECGYSLKCPRCDIPLTLHTEKDPRLAANPQNLRCHRCNYQRQMPKICPQCGSRQFRHYGTGTEKVEEEVQVLLPGVRTLRWDYETTRQKGAHEIILDHFSSRNADILIGTQMVAKGLDLPFVTLVGAVLADVSLNLPDYRTAERTFQLLTQVAGRAGRSPLGGRVILQTFHPEHYVIQAAASHDYAAFYQQELAYRRSLGYPPYSRFVRLEYRHAKADQAQRAAQALAAKINQWLAQEQASATELIGPAPCYFERVAGMYRWQIILRGPDPARLLRPQALNDWHVEVDPSSLL